MELKHVGITENNISDLRKKVKAINNMLNKGAKLATVLKKFNLTYYAYNKYLPSIFYIPKTGVQLGNKKLEDFESEEEMLNKPEYKYENLSDGERKIYDQRKEDGSLGRYFTYNDGLYGRY